MAAITQNPNGSWRLGPQPLSRGANLYSGNAGAGSAMGAGTINPRQMAGRRSGGVVPGAPEDPYTSAPTPSLYAQQQDAAYNDTSKFDPFNDPKLVALMQQNATPTDYQAALSSSQQASMQTINDQLAASLADINARQGLVTARQGAVNTQLAAAPGALQATYQGATDTLGNSTAAGNAAQAGRANGIAVAPTAPVNNDLGGLNAAYQGAIGPMGTTLNNALNQETAGLGRESSAANTSAADKRNEIQAAANEAAKQQDLYYQHQLFQQQMDEDQKQFDAANAAQAKRPNFGTQEISRKRAEDAYNFSPYVVSMAKRGEGHTGKAYNDTMAQAAALRGKNMDAKTAQAAINKLQQQMIERYPHQATAISLGLMDAGI